VSTTSESIEERILRVISTSKRIPLAAIKPDATFEELSIDSLDRLNILFDLESEFNIEIDDEEAKQATKVSDIVEGIKQLLERSGATGTWAVK
jgi:acyl carrier protein